PKAEHWVAPRFYREQIRDATIAFSRVQAMACGTRWRRSSKSPRRLAFRSAVLHHGIQTDHPAMMGGQNYGAAPTRESARSSVIRRVPVLRYWRQPALVCA